MMSKKKAAKAAKKISGLGGLEATKAIFRYRFFLRQGGKRPFIHDETGRIIAPVCDQLVPALLKAANQDMSPDQWFTLEDHLAVQSKRERLRAARRGQHEFRRAANLASARHEEEPATVAIVAAVEDDGTLDILRLAVDTYGSTEVLSRSFRDRTVVVVFWQGRAEHKPKHREVYEYEKGKETHRLTASVGNRVPIEKLEAAEWKWAKLADHLPVIEFLVEVKTSSQKAA